MLALLRRQGAGFFAQINFLVPLFGVLWGFIILSERPPATALAALAVILAGIAISRGRVGLPRPLSTETLK
jgi:drug/metabolite transporter (DMT)-like permease